MLNMIADQKGETIYKLMADKDKIPPAMHDWFDMATGVVNKCGFPNGLDRDGLIKAFNAHNDAVTNTIPAQQLLVYEVKEGWKSLCEFLGMAVPDESFPRTNGREEFWERLKKA